MNIPKASYSNWPEKGNQLPTTHSIKCLQPDWPSLFSITVLFSGFKFSLSLLDKGSRGRALAKKTSLSPEGWFKKKDQGNPRDSLDLSRCKELLFWPERSNHIHRISLLGLLGLNTCDGLMSPFCSILLSF